MRLSKKIQSAKGTLSLFEEEVQDDECEMVAREIATNTAITSVDLRENNISASGARVIASMLEKNTTITSMNLGSKIGPEGEKAIATMLESGANRSLQYIDGVDLTDSAKMVILRNRGIQAAKNRLIPRALADARAILEAVDNPLLGIFFAEFDVHFGPKILCQNPEGIISQDVFEAVADFFIMSAELCHHPTIVRTSGYKILGYPCCLQDSRYERHTYFFSVGFVLPQNVTPVCISNYQLVLSKLGTVFETLEAESFFLTSKEGRDKLPWILQKIYVDLQHNAEVKDLEVTPANAVNLKLFKKVSQPPGEIADHQVPIIVADVSVLNRPEFDLTLSKVIPMIDGVNYVKRIAQLSNVEVKLVKKCVSQLLYYGAVEMVEIFQFSNVYVPTAEVGKLYKDKQMQQACVAYVSTFSKSGKKAKFSILFKLYCSLQRGLRMGTFATQYKLLESRIDPRRFAIFGVINGLIRRVHKYPITRPTPIIANKGRFKEVPVDNHNVYILRQRMAYGQTTSLSGELSYDELCCKFGMSYAEVESEMRRAPDCVIISR